MFATYATQKEAQEVINKINSDYSKSELWRKEKIANYGDVIQLESGEFAVQVLEEYKEYFSVELVEKIEVKKIKTPL